MTSISDGSIHDDFQLHRLGMLMEPEPGNPHEVEGVLNPLQLAAGRQPVYLPAAGGAGQLLSHRHCRVRFNKGRDPSGVERMGIALEPEADYEKRPTAAAAARILALRSSNRCSTM